MIRSNVIAHKNMDLRIWEQVGFQLFPENHDRGAITDVEGREFQRRGASAWKDMSPYRLEVRGLWSSSVSSEERIQIWTRGLTITRQHDSNLTQNCRLLS